MGMVHYFSRPLNWALGLTGLELRRRDRKDAENRWSMESALHRVSKRCPGISAIIDIGAAVGDWTRIAAPAFPDAKFLLLDPLEERAIALEALRNEFGRERLAYEIVAAGDRQTSLPFNVSTDLDGSGAYGEKDNLRRVPMVTVDSLIEKHALKPPYLLKFDTHGFEVPILQGAARALRFTHAIVMECYTFEVSPSSLLFWDMCRHIESLGFRVADLADPWARKYDGALWQMDLIWLRKDDPVFQYAAYK